VSIAELIRKSRSTEGINPYPIEVSLPDRAIEFKTDRMVVRGEPMNRLLPALLPSTGLLLNSVRWLSIAASITLAL